MIKDVSKILNPLTDRIFVQECDDNGVEPQWFATDEIGYVDDASIVLTSKKSTREEAGGGLLQLNTDYDVKLNALQILDETTIALKKNRLVWILVKPFGTISASNPEIKIKNFLLNIEPMIDSKTDGKNMIVLTGSKPENDRTKVYEFVDSATSLSDVFSIFNPESL